MEKGLKGGGALKEKMEGEGPKGKFVFLLPLVARSRGGRGRRGGGAWPAALGHGGSHGGGEKGEGAKGNRFPTTARAEAA